MSRNFDNADSEVVPSSSSNIHKPGESIPSRPTTSETYDMSRKLMGKAVIIDINTFNSRYNCPKRKGSDKDVDALAEILRAFDFEVITHENLSSDEVNRVITNLTTEDHSDRNCLLVTIMSHGDSNGVIYTTDGLIYTDDIQKPFTDPKNCPTLHGKPKIFFIQACRGSLKDVGALLELNTERAEPNLASKSAPSSKTEKFVISALADILVFFSSSEGFPAFKNKHEGSWFIQGISNNLRKCLDAEHPTDFLTILHRVNREVAYSKQANTEDNFNACKQMPVIVSMLTKSMMLGGKK